MGIEDLVDVINAAGKRERSKYHLRLGDLLEALRAADSDSVVEFDIGGHPDDADSYRGHYSDLALSATDEPCTVAELKNTLESVHGETLTGYKGGENRMEDKTPLWHAEWGETGVPIVDCERDANTLTLVTGDRPDYA